MRETRWFVVEANCAQLVELARPVDQGRLRSILGEMLPLARGQDAFQHKHMHGVPSNTVLQVPGDL